MKKLFFFLLLFCVSSISAQTFKSGDLYYSVTSTNNKTVRVTQHDDHKLLVNVTVPASVEYNGESYSVTEIGNSAFSNCGALQSLTLPNSVTSIGGYAFHSCSALQSISLPDGLTSIGNDAFYYCSGLTSIEIPEGVTSIGDRAFSGCSGLETINYCGTEEQWKAISKGSYWDLYAGTSTTNGKYTIVYNYKA